jgi:hypothetical protein
VFYPGHNERHMSSWLRRTRAALATGLLWAITWAPVGILAAFIVDPTNRMDEPWLLIFAIPGFIGGVLFSALLANRARGRTLLEVSPRRAGLWGGAAGLVTGALPFFIGEPAGSISVPALATVVMSTVGVLSAASAAGSVALAQRAERRALSASTETQRIPAETP